MSALIHAATMVNAGVYLVVRANPIFASAPRRMVVVAGIGIFTAILAASIAMTQTDIKRVLAYSTLSQLGYMFAALRRRGVDRGDLPPHDPRLLQGPAVPRLRARSSTPSTRSRTCARWAASAKKIPITYVTMLIGSLAIAGIPPLAGFFSKDEILGESFKLGFWWVWLVGFIVAGLTAFYMFRLMGLTFWGDVPRPEGGLGPDPRVAAGHDDPAHPAGDPVGLPRHVPRPAARRQPDPRAGWSRSSRSPRDPPRPSQAELRPRSASTAC